MNRGILAPWNWQRKIALFAGLALALFLTFAVTFPTGIVAALTFVFLVKIWQETDTYSPDRPQYTPGTKGYTIAEFFTACRIKLSDTLNPVILLGFGSPRGDEDHQIESESWLPPARLSSWWCFIGALLLSSIDYFINPILFTAWGGTEGFKVWWFITVPISLAGWFCVLQFITEIFRWRAEGEGIIGAEPGPAVMLNKVQIIGDTKSEVIKSSVTTVAILFVLSMIVMTTKQSQLITLIAALPIWVLITLAWASKGLVAPYREKWQERIDEKNMWASNLEWMKEAQPQFLDSTPLPLEPEWEKKFPDEPYDPYMYVARLIFAPNMIYQDYLGIEFEEKIASELDAKQVVISPVPEKDPMTNQEKRGTIGREALMVWYTVNDKAYTFNDVFSADLAKWEKDFAIRETVIKKLSKIKGLGEMAFLNYTVLTRSTSKRQLLEINIRPMDHNISVNNFRDGKVIEALKTTLNLKYVRAKRQAKSDDGNVITLMMGDEPYSNIEFTRPQSTVMRTIREADYANVFHINGLYSSSGAPTLRDCEEINSVVELEFQMPQGLSFKDVKDKLDAIKENSGNSFMEIKQGPSSALDAKRKEKNKRRGRRGSGADEEDSSESNVFSITAAAKSPLDNAFMFGDYTDQILFDRTEGKPNLLFYPGVLANDQLASYEFGQAEPHLLIAGSSGSGKSELRSTPTLLGKFDKKNDQINWHWKTMGDVKSGDYVMDMDGKPVEVIHAFSPYTPEKLYTVTLSTNESITVDADHLWTVTPYAERGRSSRANKSLTNGKLQEATAGYQSKVEKFASLSVDPSQFRKIDRGSAWFYDESSGKYREASSWIDYGKMAEMNPHVSSRIAQSAMRGVPDEIWGLFIASLSPIQIKKRYYSAPAENFTAISELLNHYGYKHNLEKNSNDKTARFLIHSLAKILNKAWEESNDRAGFARDILNVNGLTARFLHGLTLGAKKHNGVYEWSNGNSLHAVEQVLKSYNIDCVNNGKTLTTPSAIVDLKLKNYSADLEFNGMNPYYLGLFDACGMELTAPKNNNTLYYLTIADPSIRYHLLERGIVSNTERTGLGVERIYTWDEREGAQLGHDRDLSRYEALEYIRGYCASHGQIDGRNVTVTVKRDNAERVRKAAAMLSGCKLDKDLEKDWFVLTVPSEYVNAASSDFLDVATTVREQTRYDKNGHVVMSIPELEKEFGLMRPAIEKYVSGITPTAVWRAPLIQTFVTGKRAKASGEIDLYPVAEVALNAIEVINDRKLDTVEHMVTLTTEEIFNTFKVAGAHNGSNYSMPLNPLYFDGAKIEDLPVHPYVLGCYLGDGYTQSGDICGIDQELFEKIKSFGFEISRIERDGHDHVDFRNVRFNHTNGKSLKNSLLELKVINPKGGKTTKHIPDVYKYASFEARLELIRGIMDTDGYNNSELTLSTENKLSYDALEVLRSLGIRVTEGVKRFEKDTHHDCLRMSFTTDLMLHHLTRKKDNAVIASRSTLGKVYITNVEKKDNIENLDVRCITVDSPTSTYRTGRTLIPTHNSVVLQNMLTQLIHNNGRNELRLWLCEPKIGLQRFRYYDLCDRFVDSWSPDEQFFENVLDWTNDLVAEMLNRNRLMAANVDPNTGLMAEKLDEAREKAEEEGVIRPDGTRHELHIPFIIAVIEECATIFAEAANKEQKDIQSQILVDVARIAREARSAGIYLVVLTQYPTSKSLPPVVKNQCGRLGLACQNELASRVVIEQGGLEKLTLKGTGMVRDGRDYATFRGFLLLSGNPNKMDKNGDPEKNDILDSLAHIPNSFLGTGGASKTSELPGAISAFVEADEIDDTVFELWNSLGAGSRLDKAIDEEKETKGMTDADYDNLKLVST